MRWRETRKERKKEAHASLLPYTIAPLSKRAKAFVVDSFMLLMPILYIVFYLIFGSREGFAAHMLVGWLLVVIPYGVLTIFFLAIQGQTPGYKAYEIKLIDTVTLQKASLVRLFVRYIIALVVFATFIGLFFPFLRKDRLSLYDIFTRCAPVLK